MYIYIQYYIYICIYIYPLILGRYFNIPSQIHSTPRVCSMAAMAPDLPAGDPKTHHIRGDRVEMEWRWDLYWG